MNSLRPQKVFIISGCCLLSLVAKPQTAAVLISELKFIDSTITNTPCCEGSVPVISNRAMNLFLADKTGYCLSEFNELSFHKNNITFNTVDGIFSLNHNMFQPKGIDEPVKSFLVAGAKANITNAFASAVSGKLFTNEFGFTLKQTWIAKTKTHVNSSVSPSGVSTQKQEMDAIRAFILHSLEAQIKKSEEEFEASLKSIEQSDVPGQELAQAKEMLRLKFYAELKEEYSLKFAGMHAEYLSSTNNFNLISTHWTSISAYIPAIAQKFVVAESLMDNFQNRHSYPVEITVGHTRFLESRKAGRFFITFYLGIFLNNSVRSYEMDGINSSEYKARGGTDTTHLSQLNTSELFIGSFQNYFTPYAKAQVVYFPPDSHVGFKFQLEQNFGAYKAQSFTFALPIVLIDKKAKPAANFEFQFRLFDTGNKIFPDKQFDRKTSISLSIGIPFSKIIY